MRSLLLLVAMLSTVSCKTLEATAAKDPMKCERDPNCKSKRSGSFDCSTQCADDPACVDRCRQVEVQAGTSGR